MLNNDKKYQDISDGEWYYAKNILITKKHGRKSNEYGFEKVSNPFTGKIIGIIELPDKFLFIEERPSGKNAFWIYNNYTFDLKFKCKAIFTSMHPIKGVYSYVKGQLVIVLTDNHTTPKYINFDCLPFKIDINGDLLNPNDIKLFDLFSSLSYPIYTLLNVDNTGGSFESGVYYLTGNYEYKDGSQTNYVHVSNPISIYDKSTLISFFQIDGCPAGTKTSKSINIQLSNLDTNYEKFNIVLIEKIGGVIRAFKYHTININSDVHEITLTNNEVKTEINILDIRINSEIFKTIGAITTLFNKLYVADVEVEDYDIPLDIGKDINVTWTREKQIPLNSYKNSYKDPRSIFHYKGFKSNEVYALYYSYVMDNGKETRAFHIPAPELDGFDTTVYNTNDQPNYGVIGNDVRRYQINPIPKFNKGMNTFENKDEVYPECYGSLAGKKVRHFRFPSLSDIYANGEKFIHLNTDINNENTVINSNIINTYTIDRIDIWNPYIILSSHSVHISNPEIGETPYYLPTNSVVRDKHFSGGRWITKIYKSSINQKLKFTLKLKHNNSKTITFPFKMYVISEGFDIIETLHSETIISSNNSPYEKEFEFTIPNNRFLAFERYESYEGRDDVYFTLNGIAYEADFNIEDSEILVTRPLGLKFADIPIPESIRGKVKGIKFYYAKRTVNNSLISGQSAAIIDNWDGSGFGKRIKLHPFDGLLDKYNTHPTFIQPVFKLDKNSMTLDLDFITKSNVISDDDNYSALDVMESYNLTRKVLDYNYIEYDTPIPNFLDFDNSKRESAVLVDLNSHLLPLENTHMYVFDLVYFRDNCYIGFENQELIDTGYFLPVKEETLTSITSDAIYGGDTFTSAYGVVLTRNQETNNVRVLKYYVESVNNIGLRHDGLNLDEIYSPKHANSEFSKDKPIYYGYNKDYTSINDQVKTIPEYCTNGCLNKTFKYDDRVYRSGTISTEGTSFWRRFNPSDYYVIDNSKGGIVNLESLNKTLLIHTKYSLFYASIKDKLETDTLKVYMGTGDIFDREPDEAMTSNYGYGGLQHRFLAKITDIGYVFLDSQQKKWFVYNGKLEELKGGISNWLQDNTAMETFRDNPYIGQGYSIGYDSENGRLLLTKNHTPTTSYTLSYIYGYGFICYHSYIPNYYIQNRLGTYALKIINNKTELFRFNNKSNKCKFFDDLPDETVIDLIGRADSATAHNVNAVLIDSETELNGNKFNECVSHIMLYNNNQCTGIIPMIPTTNSMLIKTNVRRYRNYWIFNRYKDVMKDYNSAILDRNFNLIPTSIKNNKAWFKRSNIVSPFVMVRLIHDNLNQTDIYISNINLLNGNTLI